MAKQETTLFGRTVPRLGAGGHFTIGPSAHEDVARRVREIHHQIDAGIVYFDVQWELEAVAMAEVYQTRKHEMLIAWPLHGITQQGGDLTADYILNYTRDFMKRFAIDRFDVALWIALEINPEDREKVGDAINEAVGRLKADGLVGHFGFSCHHSPGMALDAIRFFDFFEIMMTPFGPLNAAAARELFPEAKSRGIATVAMKPFGGGGGFFNTVRAGALPDRELPVDGRPYHAALRWTLANPDLDVAAPGTCSAAEIDELVAAAKTPVSADDEQMLDRYREALTVGAHEDHLLAYWR